MILLGLDIVTYSINVQPTVGFIIFNCLICSEKTLQQLHWESLLYHKSCSLLQSSHLIQVMQRLLLLYLNFQGLPRRAIY